MRKHNKHKYTHQVGILNSVIQCHNLQVRSSLNTVPTWNEFARDSFMATLFGSFLTLCNCFVVFFFRWFCARARTFTTPIQRVAPGSILCQLHVVDSPLKRGKKENNSKVFFFLCGDAKFINNESYFKSFISRFIFS